MHKVLQFRLVAPFLLCSIAISQNDTKAPIERSITFDMIQENSFDSLDSQITSSFFVKTVDFESDVYFQKAEFEYLTDIGPKSWVSVDTLKKALFYLKLKNKFSKISVHIAGDKELNIHFILEGLWTFNKVKFYGAVLGKDKYRQFYTLESNDPFDIKKHKDCLEKIRLQFMQEGYWQAKILDDLDYDVATKSVTVNVVVDPGVRYTIGHVTLKICDPENETDQEEVFTKKIIRRFGSPLDGAFYSQSQVEEHIDYLRQYLFKKGFLNAGFDCQAVVDENRKQLNLMVRIDLNHRRKCTFFGNRFFSKKELLDQIMVFGDSMSLLPSSILSQELVHAYKKRGFWSVKIETKQQNNEYFFIINEGQRVSVSNVVIKGVKSFNDQELSRKFFAHLCKQKFFDAEILKQALKNLMSAYLQDGFWDMKILKQDYVPFTKNNSYQLILTIDEGPRRILQSCSIENYPELMQKEPFASQQKRLPCPFDLNVVHEQRQYLLRYFHDQGYLYVEIKSELLENGYDLDLIWHVKFSESQVKFGKTILAGSATFPFKNLLHRMECKQGSIWQKQKIEDSLVSLRNLDCFETIHIVPYNVSTPEPEKPIIMKLVHDDPFEARLRLGFQQVGRNMTFRKGSTYRIGGSFLYKNPMNVGDYLFLNADGNRFYRYASATYFLPWNLYCPTNVIFKGYYNKYTQPVKIGSDKPLYNARQQGFLIGLTRPFKIVDFGLNLGIEVMETSGLSFELAEAINFEPRLIDRGVPYIVFEPAVLIAYLDNKLNPTRGFLTALSAKGMFSWDRSAVTFFKVLAEQSVFIPLNPLVLALRLRMGHIFNQTLRAIMPPERFFLGGAFSLRGYEPDLAPPLGVFVEDNGKKRLVPQGGKSMFNFNAELRFWIFKNFGGTIFQDFGILSSTRFSDVKPHGLLAATGFGLRYETPIGPLRFDLGFKWKRRELENSQIAWFLTFGNAF